MKTKTIFSFIATLAMTCSLMAQTQSHTISIGGGFGGSTLTGELGENGSIGLSYFLEANYFFNEKLSAGIEFNSSAIGYSDDSSAFGFSAYGSALYLVKGEYHFFTSKVSPYVGLGLGLANIATPEITSTDSNGNEQVITPSESTINFALSPRIGVAFGNFCLDVSFNVAGKTPQTEGFNVDESDLPFNYWIFGLRYVYPFEI